VSFPQPIIYCTPFASVTVWPLLAGQVNVFCAKAGSTRSETQSTMLAKETDIMIVVVVQMRLHGCKDCDKLR